MTEQSLTSDIELLSAALTNIQKSLQCTICLELMIDPIKTRCGHSFCKVCIGEVLQKRNVVCPLCKKSLNRRNVSKDDHQQACIEKFQKLLIAIQTDTHIDILSYSKRSHNTKESCSYSDADQSTRDSNKKKPSREQFTRSSKQTSNRQTNKSSIKRETTTDCDNSRYDLKAEISDRESPIETTLFATLSDTIKNENHETPTTKVRTWLHNFLDQPSTDGLTAGDKKRSRAIEKEAASIDEISNEDNKSDEIGERYRYGTDENRRIKNRKRGTDIHKEDTSRITKRKQSDGGIEIDSASSGLKYKMCHVRAREKDRKMKSKSCAVRINEDEQNSTSMIDASDANAMTQHSSANWSRVIELGKEMKRASKKKVKKLNVSTERNQPRIIENVALSPNSKYDPVRIAVNHDTDRKNISNLEDSDKRSQKSTADNSPDLTKMKASETSIHNRAESCGKNNINTSPSNSAMESSYVILEEDEHVHITNLNCDQVNQIIGFKEQERNKRENEHDEKNVDVDIECFDLPQKRIIILTPEKLNESMRRRDVTLISNKDIANPLAAENQSTPGRRDNNDVQRVSGGSVSSQQRSPTPNKSRLSLRRKLASDDNKRVDSPLLNMPPSDTMSIDKCEINSDDRKSVDSPITIDDSMFNRLMVVKRDLSLQMTPVQNQLQIVRGTRSVDASSNRTIDVEDNRENVSGIIRRNKEAISNIVRPSKILNSIKNQEHKSPVKFMQLDNQVMKQYGICNMQKSTYESEMEDANASGNLTVFEHLNDTHDSINTTGIENIDSMNNSNANRAVAKNAGLCAASPTCVLSATSTPKRDVDRFLNGKKTERSSSEIVCQRSCKSTEDAAEENARSLRETPRADRSSSRIGSLHSVKLLSPEKDSQLQFLAIDSPMSEHEQSGRANKPAIKGDNFSKMESRYFATSMSEMPSVAKADKKRKRAKRLSDRELFEDRSNNSDDSQDTIKFEMYDKLCENARSSDGSKKRRFSPTDDQYIEVDSSDTKKEDTPKRKYKRIIRISSSEDPDTETKSTAHVAKVSDIQYSARQESDKDFIRNIIDRWNDEHNEMHRKLIKGSGGTQMSVKSRYPIEEKSTSHRLSQRSNEFGIETRKNSSEKDSAAKESDMFESSSIFNVENVDAILRQSAKPAASAPLSLEKVTDVVINDDIINRVLRIDRSRDARLSSGYDPCQRGKNSGDYLLQDNFDEMIANVELPRSEVTIPKAIEQPGRNLNRPLAVQRTPNCYAMTDEACDAVRDTPMIPASSTSDIFENSGYSSRNVKKATNVTARNCDKENVMSYSQRKHDCTVERGNGKDVTSNFVDEIGKNPGRKITPKQNISRDKDRSLEERDVSIRSTTGRLCVDDKIQRETMAVNDSRNDACEEDTLMNITQQQDQLRSFEKCLFGAPAVRSETKTTRIVSQDDLFRKELRTPRKRRQDSQSRNSTPEEHSIEEDDIVENTPERKLKKGTNSKPIEPRRNIAISYPSPMPAERTPSSPGSLRKRANPESDVDTPMSRLEIHPLCQSTPKIAHHSTISKSSSKSNRLDVATNDKKIEVVMSGSILLPKQVGSKKPDNIHQQVDRRELCFVCSSLIATQTMIVKEFATKYDARYVNQFERDVTHVIVNTTGEHNIAKSTLKFLQGIAHRKWIVSYRWIEDCIRQQRLLDEASYEAVTYLDGVNYTGPRDSRLRTKGLFEGFTFLCVGPYVNVSLIQYQDLLLATGAAVVDSFETLAKKGGIKGVVIQENVHEDKEIEHWYRTAKAAPIVDDWIVECIGQYKLFKFLPYVLSPQNYFTIGYPPELVEDEEYHDDGE